MSRASADTSAVADAVVSPAARSIESRFLRASGLVMIGHVTSRVVSLIIGIATARLLTEPEFGAFGVIQSTLGMFGAAAGLSLGMAATRYVARYRLSEPDRVRGVMLVTLGIGTVSTTATSIVLFLGAPWIVARFLGGDAALIGPLRWAATQLACTSLFGIVAGILAGKERFGVVGATAVLQNLAILIASILLIPRLHLSGAVAAQGLGLATALAVGTWTIRDLGRGLSWRELLAAMRREHRILVEFCLPNVLAAAIMLPAAWLSVVLIFNTENGSTEMAFFTAADRFRLLLGFVAGFVGTALLPILSSSSAAGAAGNGEGARSVELGLIGTGLMVLPLTALFAFGGPTLMAAFGRSYQTNWSVLLPVLAWGAAGAVGSIVGTALVAHGRQWFIFLQQVAYGVTIVGLTLWLRPLGGAGLGLAHLGAVLVLLAWSYPVIRRLGVVSERVTRQLVMLTVAVTGICLVSWWCPAAWRLPLALPATAAAFAGAMLLLSTSERSRLVDLLRNGGWRSHLLGTSS